MRWLVHAELDAPWRDGAKKLLELEGTILSPTFTYSFCKSGQFDPKKSRGESGLFGNYLLNQPGAVRSDHPIFSFAGVGPEARELLDGVSRSSFGKESLFDRFAKRGGRLLFAGASFESCTFVHYVEQQMSVSYRYSKEFFGYDYFVRPLDGSVITSLAKLEESLKKRGRLVEMRPNWWVVEVKDFIEETRSCLKEDPHFLLQASPTIKVGP